MINNIIILLFILMEEHNDSKLQNLEVQDKNQISSQDSELTLNFAYQIWFNVVYGSQQLSFRKREMEFVDYIWINCKGKTTVNISYKDITEVK